SRISERNADHAREFGVRAEGRRAFPVLIHKTALKVKGAGIVAQLEAGVGTRSEPGEAAHRIGIHQLPMAREPDAHLHFEPELIALKLSRPGSREIRGRRGLAALLLDGSTVRAGELDGRSRRQQRQSEEAGRPGTSGTASRSSHQPPDAVGKGTAVRGQSQAGTGGA